MTDRRRYGVFGCSLRARVWRRMLREAFASLRLTHTIRAWSEEEDDLLSVVTAVRSGECAGLILTGKDRWGAVDVADEIDSSAQVAHSANLLMPLRSGQLAALHTEVLGMRDHLLDRVSTPMCAVVIGSGVIAAAAAASCLTMGTKVVAMTSRSWTSTEALHESEGASRLRELGVLAALWPCALAATSHSKFSDVLRLQFADMAASADIIVHATRAFAPDGENPDDVLGVVPWDRVKPGALVCDMDYRTGGGPFADYARSRGLAVVTGLDMLALQAARTVEVWTGLRPPLAPVHMAATRATLESGER